jgi:peptidoglycan/xylan/chitin deacetylase (PgdA/CDA1 family)
MAFTSIRTRRARSALAALVFAGIPIAASAAECRGTLYLTIDTGNMAHAEPIARVLNEEKVKATFFLANEPTFRRDHALDPSWDGYWRARAEEGHAFGNHTWSHRTIKRDNADRVVVADANGNPDLLDANAFCAELKKVDAAFNRATGKRLGGLWRAPGGRTSGNAIRYAASCGYPVHVHWDDAGFLGDELPSERYPNQSLLERALKNVRPGDVLMMHLGIWSRRDPYAPMLKPLLQGLKARGFCFATLPAGTR